MSGTHPTYRNELLYCKADQLASCSFYADDKSRIIYIYKTETHLKFEIYRTHSRVTNISSVNLAPSDSSYIETIQYSSSDFIDKKVPSRLIVWLQGPGGHGGRANKTLIRYDAGSGGGSGAFYAAVIDLEKDAGMSNYPNSPRVIIYVASDSNDSFVAGPVVKYGPPSLHYETLFIAGAGAYGSNYNENGTGDGGEGGKTSIGPAQVEGVGFWTILTQNGAYGGSGGGTYSAASKGSNSSALKIPSTKISNWETYVSQNSYISQTTTAFSGGSSDSNGETGGGAASLFGSGGNGASKGGYGDHGTLGSGGGGDGAKYDPEFGESILDGCGGAGFVKIFY